MPILLVPFVVQFGTVSPARAMGGGDGCNPNRRSDLIHYRFNGYSAWDRFNGASQNDFVYGAEANILVYSPWVDYRTATVKNKEYSSDVTAWTMLQNRAAPTTASYAQDGWIELPKGSRHDLIEFADSQGHDYQYLYNPAPINNSVTYRTEFNPNDTMFRFYLGDWSGSQARMTVPISKVNFAPNEAEFFVETHSGADQEAGGTSYNENFWWPQVMDQHNGNYHIADTYYGINDSSSYGLYPGTGWQSLYNINHFSTWDTACGH